VVLVQTAAGNNRERTYRLFYNIFGGMVGRVITLTAPFLVMPLMLRHLGDLHFGVWMTAVTITSVAQFSDLGIGNGLLTRLSNAFGRDDYAGAQRDISSAYAKLTAVATILAVIAGFVFVLIAKGYTLFGNTPIEIASLAIIAASFGAFFVGIPISIIHRVMYARQQAVLSNIWQIIGATCSVIGCWLAIGLQLPSWSVVLAYALPSVLITLISTFWYFTKYPEIRPRLIEIDLESGRVLLSLGMRFLALSVVISIALNADNIIIAINLGAQSVTDYSVPAKIGSLLGLVVTTLFTPLWAANGEALARGDYQWIRTSMRRMAWIGVLSVGASGIALTAAADWIIHIWMNRGFNDQQLILGSLASFSTIMAATAPYNMVLNASGRIGVQITAWTFFGIISIALKVAFVSPHQLWLIPLISSIIYSIIITPTMFLTTRRILSMSFTRQP
jgi:O-antigen/teichoic acid export membrane protein